MADSFNEFFTQQSGDGIAYPQDFVLESCVIVSALGQPTDFSKAVVELNYFEDIYSGAISGNLLVNDSNSFLNRFSLSGNDYLQLSFGKPGLDTRKITKIFRIYSVSNRGITKDQNENYLLNFCSEEVVLSEQYKVSKSYRNFKVSDIVKDILKNQINTRPEKVLDQNIEETKGMRDIIIPTLKPFEAINWLCTQAISNTSKTEGSPYVFFENYNGYNFKSLQTLYGQKVYQLYKYEPKNTNMPEDKRVQDMGAEMLNVLSYDHVSNFDFINSVNTGGFANRLIAIDPVRQTYSVNDFDYDTYIKKTEGPSDVIVKSDVDYKNLQGTTRLNDGILTTNAKNRKGDMANTAYNSVLKMVTTNTGQSTLNEYIKKHEPSVKDIFIETRVPFRTAQMSHIHTVRLKISIPGDPLMTVGNVIEFYLPEQRRLEDGSRMWDLFYSGRFLVTAVRHTLSQENKYITTMEISKESLFSNYANFNNELPSWKEIRGR